jgi:hypothetical protein
MTLLMLVAPFAGITLHMLVAIASGNNMLLRLPIPAT